MLKFCSLLPTTSRMISSPVVRVVQPSLFFFPSASARLLSLKRTLYILHMFHFFFRTRTSLFLHRVFHCICNYGSSSLPSTIDCPLSPVFYFLSYSCSYRASCPLF
ncbi:hypothetical protein M407DRAFT_204528 [Tulasnella calospora MUT 4182]|uniref:Uncharacterized protein n=1 Tax=Tulasnella calospora MUT 4182 TaxID=1051891 RepID=A0A0C3MHA0_9AGAM|nr:hypothetical protein M407DRAFT_204528 [Tulasnella calospora MUT 4182]